MDTGEYGVLRVHFRTRILEQDVQRSADPLQGFKAGVKGFGILGVCGIGRREISGDASDDDGEHYYGSLNMSHYDLPEIPFEASISHCKRSINRLSRFPGIRYTGTMNMPPGKVRPIVVITGVYRGLGSILMRDLVRSCRIWAVTRTREQENAVCTSTPGVEQWFHGNLDHPDVAFRIARACRHGGESIHGIVHCPGRIEYTRDVVPSWDIWARLFESNVAGAVHLIRSLGGAMRCGRIVLMGFSGNEHPQGYRRIAAYAAAKNALVVLARSAARDLAVHGTTVNVVAPGIFEDENGSVPGEGLPLRNAIPLERFGTPKDITGPVRWLLSDKSAYVTGQVIKVSGGLHI